jgi:hypothetical protein
MRRNLSVFLGVQYFAAVTLAHASMSRYVCVCLCMYVHCICMYCLYVGPPTGAQNPPPCGPCPQNTALCPRTSRAPLTAFHDMCQSTLSPIPFPPFDPIFLEIRCLDLSCHGRRMIQDPPDKLKRGPIALLGELYKT